MNGFLKWLLIHGAKYGLSLLDGRLDDILEADKREQLKSEIIAELKGDSDGSKNA